MTRRTYMILNAVLLATVDALCCHPGQLWVLVVAVVCATGLSISSGEPRRKKSAKDERTTLLYEKAAGATLRLTLPLAAIGSLVLLVAEGSSFGRRDTVGVCAELCRIASFCWFTWRSISYYSRKH